MRQHRRAQPCLALVLAVLAAGGCGASGGAGAPAEVPAAPPPPAEAAPSPPPAEPPVPQPPGGKALRTVAEWEALFARAWDEEHAASLLPASRSGNSWRHYGLAYAVDGLTAMFEATGDVRYLEGALGYAENVIGTAVPSSRLPRSPFQDRFLGWAASGHPSDRSIRGGEYPLYESYLFRYVGKLLRVMRHAPAIAADPALRARHDAILAFTKANVWDKWTERGAGNVYRENVHMAAHWAFLALELLDATADPAEAARYRAVVDDVNLHLPNRPASLRQQLRPHPRDPDAWIWSGPWGAVPPPAQDVSHANGLVAYVVEAHRLGVEWTDADVARLARTLRVHVWRADGSFARDVDGSGEGNGWINDGFAKLGRFDPAIQERLETYAVGRGVQLYGNAALNAKLLFGSP